MNIITVFSSLVFIISIQLLFFVILSLLLLSLLLLSRWSILKLFLSSYFLVLLIQVVFLILLRNTFSLLLRKYTNFILSRIHSLLKRVILLFLTTILVQIIWPSKLISQNLVCLSWKHIYILKLMSNIFSIFYIFLQLSGIFFTTIKIDLMSLLFLKQCSWIFHIN